MIYCRSKQSENTGIRSIFVTLLPQNRIFTRKCRVSIKPQFRWWWILWYFFAGGTVGQLDNGKLVVFGIPGIPSWKGYLGVYPDSKPKSNSPVPTWELTYPISRQFWRWFSFSEAGICWFLEGSWLGRPSCLQVYHEPEYDDSEPILLGGIRLPLFSLRRQRRLGLELPLKQVGEHRWICRGKVILEKPHGFGDRKELHGINGNLRMIYRYLHMLDFFLHNIYIYICTIHINKIVVSKTKSFLAIFPDCRGRWSRLMSSMCLQASLCMLLAGCQWLVGSSTPQLVEPTMKRWEFHVLPWHMNNVCWLLRLTKFHLQSRISPWDSTPKGEWLIIL